MNELNRAVTLLLQLQLGRTMDPQVRGELAALASLTSQRSRASIDYHMRPRGAAHLERYDSAQDEGGLDALDSRAGDRDNG